MLKHNHKKNTQQKKKKIKKARKENEKRKQEVEKKKRRITSPCVKTNVDELPLHFRTIRRPSLGEMQYAVQIIQVNYVIQVLTYY